MQKEDLSFFREWFSDYVNNLDSVDPFVCENIKWKYEHSIRVCNNILLLAKSEGVDEKGCRLAEAIALFHDVGRFEQFIRYRTFKDSESENHALFGIKILRNAGILEHLSEGERHLILKAIEYHNLKEIPESTRNSDELIFYSELIRDADKIDILRLLSKNYDEVGNVKNCILEGNMPDTTGCSRSIVKDILNNKIVTLEDVSNLNDIKLYHLSWVFDINFPATHSILKKHRYVDTIISFMPETEEICGLTEHVRNYLGEAYKVNYIH